MGELYPTPTTLLELALETGAWGPMMDDALRSAQETEAGSRALLALVQEAAPTEAAERIAAAVATRARLTLLLREEPIDWPAADAVIGRLGGAAAELLIEALIQADARAVRRLFMDRLAQLGPAIAPAVLEHVSDERWQVVRNMAVLLREAGCEVAPGLAERLAGHPEPRVRREALLLRLVRTGARERALSDALRDPDRLVIRAALHAAGHQLPESGVLVLARRVGEADFPGELRVPALLLLGRSDMPAALAALLRAVTGGRRLLGRPQLAPKSPELLAALAGLARRWPDEPRARVFLDLAGRSGEPDVLGAIRPRAAAEVE
ncbi:MAG: hypothetical protein FIB01_07840 [Gemmatimonadetes bacterium]|nr:hypothetical protein [Gemmatimonadota bacterium]